MSLTIEVPPSRIMQPAYLERELPIVVILGSFLVLTLPLCIAGLTHPDLLERFYVKPVYMWLLATTHFVVTLTIYLQSRNLHYFNSTWMNRCLYFLIPGAIFIVFDVYTALEIALIAPGFDRIFRACIRLMDNYHVTRQSFGVTQLFKRRSGLKFPPLMRNLEETYFHMLTALLLITYFTGGSFKVTSPLALAAAGIAVCLFIAILLGFARMYAVSQDRRSLVPPVVYFLMQSGSAALGIYHTSLYLYCLAMHYVEYHVLMIPRCFNTTLDPASRTDRVFGRLRRHWVIFFGLLIGVAGVATYLTWTTMGILLERNWTHWPAPYRVLLAVFDGLFVFHYFIEALIWKFGNPFYRSTLGPLYFGPRSQAPQIASVSQSQAQSAPRA
jgi:hypothetical protein